VSDLKLSLAFEGLIIGPVIGRRNFKKYRTLIILLVSCDTGFYDYESHHRY